MRNINSTVVGLNLLFGLVGAASSKSTNTTSSVSFHDDHSLSGGFLESSATNLQSLTVSPTISKKDTSTTSSQSPSVSPTTSKKETSTTASQSPSVSLKLATDTTVSSSTLKDASISKTSHTTTTPPQNAKQPNPIQTTECEPCRLYGGSVKIFKWAEPDAPKNSSWTYASTYVNSNNYTFTSPSVYVEFQSLYATDSCSSTIGSPLGSTTLAFGQHELSTGTAWFSGYIPPSYNDPIIVDANPQVAALQTPTFTVADFNEPLKCTQHTTTLIWWGTNYATTQRSPNDFVSTVVEYTYNPCSPAISVPTELYKLEPDWLTCLPGVNALCDPPYTLTPASGLVAFTTGSTPTQTQTPQKQIVPAKPTATATPSPTLENGPSQTATNDPSDSTTSTIAGPPAESPSGNGSDPPATPPSETAPSSNVPEVSLSPSATPASDNAPSPNVPEVSSNPSSNNPPAPSTTIIIHPVAQPSPSNVPLGGTTLSNDPTPQQSDPSPIVITIGSSTLTPISSSVWVYDSQTLSRGGAVTVSGAVYSISDPSPTPIINSIPAVVTIASSIISSNSDGFFVYGSQTLTPGGVISVSGSVYSIPTPALQPAYPAVVTIGSSIMTANSAGNFVYGAQTLVPGQTVTLSGAVYTIPSPTPGSFLASPPTVITIGSSIMTANSAGDFVYGSQTLVPGQTITVSGSVYAVPSQTPGSLLGSYPTVITIGSSIMTANSAGDFVYGSQTLVPGASITVSGSVYTIPSPTPGSVLGSSPAVITIGSSTMTANSAGDFVYGSQTLTPGQHITISGSVYAIPSRTPDSLPGSYPTVITIGSSILTANSAGDFVYGSQTLVPGASITVSGSVYSYPTLFPASSAGTTSTSDGIGGAILSVGGFASSTSSPQASSSSIRPSNVAVATGGIEKNRANMVWVAACLWIPVLEILIH